MTANFNKEKAYSNIIKNLIEKIPKEADKKFVSENMNIITKNLLTFSDYVRKVMDISVEKIPISSKIKKVTETKIFNSNLKLDEAREILNKLYQEFNKNIQLGGTVGGEKEEEEGEEEEEGQKEGEEEEDKKIVREKYNKDDEDKNFLERYPGMNKFGQGVDIKELGENEKDIVEKWWNDVGFKVFLEDESEETRTAKYLRFFLAQKKYNMILIINTLCDTEKSRSESRCQIKDFKQSVEKCFEYVLDKIETRGNRGIILDEIHSEVREGVQEIFESLLSNKYEFIRRNSTDDDANKLIIFAANIKNNPNLLQLLNEEYMDTINSLVENYNLTIEKLEKYKETLQTEKGISFAFADEQKKILSNNIITLEEIIDTIEKFDEDRSGYLRGLGFNDDEIEDVDEEEEEEEDDYEDDISALERERGADDLETILDLLAAEIPDFNRKSDAAKRIQRMLEKQRTEAAEKGFNEVATKTQEDRVTNELNEQLKTIKRDNPQCKLPQYAINPIKIAALKKMRQNVDASVGFCFSNMTLLATKLFSSFPKYSSLILSKWFHDLSKLYNFDWHDFADFSRKLDWVYLYLFIISSVPFIGFWSDLLIIVRAIKEGRGFLSILTFVTSFISMFTFHMIDVGMIIKLLYFLDTTSYNSAKYEGSKPNMVDSDVVFSRGSVDFNVAKDFISGKGMKKSKKDEESFFSVAENMVKSLIKEKGVVPDKADDIDDEYEESGHRQTGKHKLLDRGISDIEKKCDIAVEKLAEIIKHGNINISNDERDTIINSTGCDYNKSLKQILEMSDEKRGEEDDRGDDDEFDDDDEITYTEREDYLRTGVDIKPDAQIIKKRGSHVDDKRDIGSFKRNPIVDEGDALEMTDSDGNQLGEYGTLSDSSDNNTLPHPWHRCVRYNYITDRSKRKLTDYCHRCYDPIDFRYIGGKDPINDFAITDEDIINTVNREIKEEIYPKEMKQNWELHYSLLTKFMNNKTIQTRKKCLEEIKEMLKEPELPGSVEEDLIDEEGEDEDVFDERYVKPKLESKIKPDIKPNINPTGFFGQISPMSQFGKANKPVLVSDDDNEIIDIKQLTEPESGVGYPQNFSKEHQEIEKFRPCDQPGVDCAQSAHGIAYKPNYDTKVCEKVKLVAAPNLFGASLSRDKPPGSKEYTIVGRDKGGARNKCQKDLNKSITIDLTKNLPDGTPKPNVKKITEYLAKLREKYGELINNKKAVMTDWNRNKSELEKIVTNARHGIDVTNKGFDKAVYKCIPQTLPNSRNGFRKGNCVWSPSGKKTIGDNIVMNWKPEGKLYENNDTDRNSCQQACVETLNNGSEKSKNVIDLKRKEDEIQKLLEDENIEKIMKLIESDN